MGDPTGKAEEAPSRTAESKRLERKGTDNIYNRKQQSLRKQPFYICLNPLTTISCTCPKMETTVQAPFSGTIKDILVSNGDAIQTGDLLIELSLQK